MASEPTAFATSRSNSSIHTDANTVFDDSANVNVAAGTRFKKAGDSELAQKGAEAAAGAPTAQTPGEHISGAEHKLSQGRKWFLLLVFSVAQYLDVCSYSGIFLFTERISEDLGIKYLSSTWVITAYSVTFASFLLFWGRVADLYSAKPVFAFGFLGLAVTNLIISFMPNQYAYFVFRAISGVFAAGTIPAAFRLIPAVFEPQELEIAYMLFGLSGAIANITGLIFAGFFGYIHVHNQNADWRWFYRMITIVIVPFAIAAFALIPHTSGARANEVTSGREKVKRFDFPGAFLMLIATILLILGMTLGATYGFKTAKFLVPFLLSWPLSVAFFVWEARLPPGFALIPPSFWFLPNMTLLMFLAIGVYSVWGFILIGFLERWEVVNGQSPIISAVRFLPAGISAFAIAFVVPGVLQKFGAKWPIVAGYTLGGVGYVLFVYSHGNLGNDYWRYDFPGLVIGSGAIMAAFLGINITVMTSVPPETSGVAGAMLQVCLQVGAVLGLSIQAGLLTIKPGNIENEYNAQASYWFIFGWCILNAILALVFFRQGKVAPGGEAANAQEAETAKATTEGSTA